MAPKRATRQHRSQQHQSQQQPPTTNNTSTNAAQLQAMIDQGVSAALAARDANRNGVDSHTSGTGVRGSKRVAREWAHLKSLPGFHEANLCISRALKEWCSNMWNSHGIDCTYDIAYAKIWVDLRKKMTDKYVKNEMKKHRGCIVKRESDSFKAKTMQEAVEMLLTKEQRDSVPFLKDKLKTREVENLP
ncbi:hypothetical protein Tco_0412621 [Tanacetum coccineum]